MDRASFRAARDLRLSFRMSCFQRLLDLSRFVIAILITNSCFEASVGSPEFKTVSSSTRLRLNVFTSYESNIIIIITIIINIIISHHHQSSSSLSDASATTSSTSSSYRQQTKNNQSKMYQLNMIPQDWVSPNMAAQPCHHQHDHQHDNPQA